MFKVKVIQEEVYKINADNDKEAIEIVDEGKKKPVSVYTSYEVEEIGENK